MREEKGRRAGRRMKENGEVPPREKILVSSRTISNNRASL